MTVITRYFEATGDAAKIAADLFTQRDNAWHNCAAACEELGAIRWRPQNRDTLGIRSLLFAGDKPPTGWRVVGRASDGIECVPRKGSKAETALKSCETYGPSDGEIATALGYNCAYAPAYGNNLYFPTASHLKLPKDRYLVSFPFSESNEFEPRADLIELRESQYVAAFEAHNEAVRTRKAA